jgi:hypothetical protein
MNDPRPRYWFPAKRYGWGWSLPSCWQGWVVLLVYLAAVAVMMPFITAHAGKSMAMAFLGVITLALLFIVYKKGEPPGWRWGR